MLQTATDGWLLPGDFDNDGDNQIDFPNDPGCSFAGDNDEGPDRIPAACADGRDNDGDGITDLAEQNASQALLQAKGRWASDVYRIYTRMTRRAQLAASHAMQRRGGRDMEELFPAFTQGR